MDYSKLYSILFNAITDAERCLSAGEVVRARQILTAAQKNTENLYIEAGDESGRILHLVKPEE